MAEKKDFSFSCYVRGDAVKGWPTFKFPSHTWGVVTLGEAELKVVSGWTSRSVIRIPVKDIISVVHGKYKRLSAELDTFSLTYKDNDKVKRLDILLRYYAHMTSVLKIKDYMAPYMKKEPEK